jgi:hypothetical protein
MPLATDIYSGNVFRFMKLEQSMAGEDSELEKTSSELAGTHFTIGKNKIPMKFLESKRSKIGIIAELHRILNGFPNLGVVHVLGRQQCVFLLVRMCPLLHG